MLPRCFKSQFFLSKWQKYFFLGLACPLKLLFCSFVEVKLMTYSLKPSFSIPSCNNFNHYKKTCFRTEKQFTRNLFQTTKNKAKLNFFISVGNRMVGKIIQSFVVRNFNFVPKMFQRCFLSFSSQTLVLLYILQHVKGT